MYMTRNFIQIIVRMLYIISHSFIFLLVCSLLPKETTAPQIFGSGDPQLSERRITASAGQWGSIQDLNHK